MTDNLFLLNAWALLALNLNPTQSDIEIFMEELEMARSEETIADMCDAVSVAKRHLETKAAALKVVMGNTPVTKENVVAFCNNSNAPRGMADALWAYIRSTSGLSTLEQAA